MITFTPLPSWSERAACLDSDPELFFLDSDDSADMKAYKTRKARDVCAGCPVMEQCRAWGMEEEADRWSIFAGLTPGQRRQKRRERERWELVR